MILFSLLSDNVLLKFWLIRNISVAFTVWWFTKFCLFTNKPAHSWGSFRLTVACPNWPDWNSTDLQFVCQVCHSDYSNASNNLAKKPLESLWREDTGLSSLWTVRRLRFTPPGLGPILTVSSSYRLSSQTPHLSIIWVISVVCVRWTDRQIAFEKSIPFESRPSREQQRQYAWAVSVYSHQEELRNGLDTVTVAEINILFVLNRLKIIHG